MLRLGRVVRREQPWRGALRRALRAHGVDPAEFARSFEAHPRYEQKGVDTLIVLDLVALAQRSAYDTAVLVSGDDDLTDAVEVVQAEGRRVMLAIPDGASPARRLSRVVDQVIRIDHGDLRSILALRSPGDEPDEAGAG